MSKAILGAVELVGAGLIFVANPAAGTFLFATMIALGSSGVAMEAGAIASALTDNRGMNITTRTPAGLRQIIRGQQRVGGQIVYRSTTGTGGSGGNYVYNYIIALATHQVDAGINLYLDGRQVYWKQTANPHGYRANMGQGTVSTPPTTSVTISGGAITAISASGGSGFADVKPVDGYRVVIRGNGTGAQAYATNSGTISSPVWTVHILKGGSGYTTATAEIQGKYTFGGTGAADVQDPSQSGYGLGYGIGPNGAHYNFSGKVYCEMRWGDQPLGDIMQSLVDNDGAWLAGPGGNSNQATAIAIINPISQQLVAAEVTSGGGGYTGSTIAITFSNGGTGTGYINGGRLSYITITYAGSNVSTAPSVNIPAPAGGQSAPSLCGCAYLYLNVGYDPDNFPQEPEIRVTVSGKNNIYDPRTGTQGYSSNWALQVADAITDATWGLGDNTVNQAQLVAAANICDQMITSQGGQESQYALHTHYDTSTSPGEALARMMDAADGRLSRIGGQWYIWPAAWPGSSFNFNESSLIESIQWNPYRSPDELFNRVTGVYTAPTYPYNVAGNLYDSNGWWNGTTQTNFQFCWQPTDYPIVACDALHGFANDIYLAQDNGIVLPRDVPQTCVISIAQAQRVGMIKLLRNRFQGTGTLHMSMAAFQLQPNDVIEFTSPTMGWVNQYLEVTGVSTHIEYDEESGAPKLSMIVQVAQTDPSIYEWTSAFEMTPYDQPAFPGDQTVTVQPPTNISIEDDSSTALVQSDGTSTPRALVTWTPPADVYVNIGGGIQIQYQFFDGTGNTGPLRPTHLMNPFTVTSGPQNGQTIYGTVWVDAGTVQGTASYFYIDIPAGFTNIAVQLRAVRSNGATSAWVQDNAYLGGAPHLPTRPQPIITLGGVGVAGINYPGGASLQSLQPAQAGADVTAQNVAGGVAAGVIVARANSTTNPISANGIGTTVNDTANGAVSPLSVSFTNGWSGLAWMAVNTGFVPGTTYDIYVRMRSNGAGNLPTYNNAGLYDPNTSSGVLEWSFNTLTTSYQELYAGRITLGTDPLYTFFSGSGTGYTTTYYIDYIIFIPTVNLGTNTVDGNGRFAAIEASADNTANHVTSSVVTSNSSVAGGTVYPAPIPGLGFVFTVTNDQNSFSFSGSVSFTNAGSSASQVAVGGLLNGTNNWAAVVYPGNGYLIPAGATVTVPYNSTIMANALAPGAYSLQFAVAAPSTVTLNAGSVMTGIEVT